MLFEKELQKLIVSKDSNSHCDTISQNSPKFVDYKRNSFANISQDHMVRMNTTESKNNMDENFGSSHKKSNELFQAKENYPSTYNNLGAQISNYNSGIHIDPNSISISPSRKNSNLTISNLSNTHYASIENSLNKILGKINNQNLDSNFNLVSHQANLGSFSNNLGNNNITSNNPTLTINSSLISPSSALNNFNYNDNAPQRRISFNKEFGNMNNNTSNNLEMSPSIIDIGTSACSIYIFFQKISIFNR